MSSAVLMAPAELFTSTKWKYAKSKSNRDPKGSQEVGSRPSMGGGTGGAGGGSGRLPPFMSQGKAVFIISNPLLSTWTINNAYQLKKGGNDKYISFRPRLLLQHQTEVWALDVLSYGAVRGPCRSWVFWGSQDIDNMGGERTRDLAYRCIVSVVVKTYK